MAGPKTTSTETTITATSIVDEYESSEVNLTLHACHPLYIHPNDHPGMTLVT